MSSRKGSSGSEAEDFDPNAAFFTQVVNKKKKTTGGASEAQPPTKPKHGETRLPSKDEDNVSLPGDCNELQKAFEIPLIVH